MKRKGLTLEQKKGLKGFLFITPWLFGFLFLFLRSIIQSICFVFSDVSMSENGVVMNFSGLENIKFALFTDTEFIPKVVEAIQTMLFQVPWSSLTVMASFRIWMTAPEVTITGIKKIARARNLP